MLLQYFVSHRYITIKAFVSASLSLSFLSFFKHTLGKYLNDLLFGNVHTHTRAFVYSHLEVQHIYSAIFLYLLAAVITLTPCNICVDKSHRRGFHELENSSLL